MKSLWVQKVGSPDEFQTPNEALDYLIPFIKKDWNIWECACGKGNIVKYLREKGFNIIGTDKETNFLTKQVCCDVIITNPPYSLKDEFLERCYRLQKPFALLMPLSALEGKKRGSLYEQFGLQMIIPNKRINFETPNGKGSGTWFQTAWFCWGFELPKDLMFMSSRTMKNAYNTLIVPKSLK